MKRARIARKIVRKARTDRKLRQAVRWTVVGISPIRPLFRLHDGRVAVAA